MYTRGYRPTQGASEAEPRPETVCEDTVDTTAPPEAPRVEKRRYKARRKMPEFKCESVDALTPDPQNPQKAECGLFTHDELFVLALTALLVLEGSDDILVLALGYVLCP